MTSAEDEKTGGPAARGIDPEGEEAIELDDLFTLDEEEETLTLELTEEDASSESTAAEQGQEELETLDEEELDLELELLSIEEELEVEGEEGDGLELLEAIELPEDPEEEPLEEPDEEAEGEALELEGLEIEEGAGISLEEKIDGAGTDEQPEPAVEEVSEISFDLELSAPLTPPIEPLEAGLGREEAGTSEAEEPDQEAEAGETGQQAEAGEPDQEPDQVRSPAFILVAAAPAEPETTPVESEPEQPALDAEALAEAASEAVRASLDQALARALDPDRLAALIAEKVEKAVWEVVPPLAEKLLREAIEKLKNPPD